MGLNTQEDYEDEIKRLAKAAEQLRAYDLCIQAHDKFKDSPFFKHQACLALARSGATEQALQKYDEFNLSLETSSEDIRALKGRLEKDYALAHQEPQRSEHFKIAAMIYEDIFHDTLGYYPGINAATCYALAGLCDKAKGMATRVLECVHGESTATMADAYYREATRAEAYLLLSDYAKAEDCLVKAKKYIAKDFAAVAATKKQLKLICPTEHCSLLDTLQNPSVLHFCGHMISADGRFTFDEEGSVEHEIAEHLERYNVGFGFGSLASGADLLFTEQLLERHAALEVILPFDLEEFIQLSVAPAGEEWVKRFHAVIQKASAVSFATEDQYLNDDSLFNYCSQLAMGAAVLRSEFLETDVLQMALWDGKPPSGVAGTAIDVMTWKSLGLPQEIIKTRSYQASGFNFQTVPSGHGGRVLKAILFGDIKGFSKLKEAQIPVFVEKILGVFAQVSEDFKDDIEFINTWGDGLFLVLPDVEKASRVAIALQEKLKVFLGQNPSLSTHALRLGAHYGPVIQTFDPVLKKDNFFGVHISRAARVEPVTPVGEVYATWPFASELSLSRSSEFKVNYVGHLPAAKSYGCLKMYVLRKH